MPSGSETCSFCIMLASRGFVYHNAKQAGENGHYHANCDCRIVPGFDGETKVTGYDPDMLYDQWKHPEKHPELREARNARRRELYAEKRSNTQREIVRSGDASAAYRGKTAKQPVKWNNPDIENLSTPEEIKERLATSDVEVTDAFMKLPIEIQKGVVAGFEYAKDTYGETAVTVFDAFKSSAKDGAFYPATGKVKISTTASDPFLTGLHETLHGVDAARSAKMNGAGDTLYSESVLAEVRKELGLKSDDAYADALVVFTGYKTDEANYLLLSPEEILPYVAERAYLGKKDSMTVAIDRKARSYAG